MYKYTSADANATWRANVNQWMALVVQIVQLKTHLNIEMHPEDGSNCMQSCNWI